MSKYYCLIAGLPELTLEDSKLNYTVESFKTDLYSELSAADKHLVDLFYLKFDNANVLKLLKDKDASIDIRGVFSVEQLSESISFIKESGTPEKSYLPSYLSSFISSYFIDTNSHEQILQEDALAGAYYAYAMQCSNKFVSSWFAFNLNVNNILLALTARKYKQDVALNIVGDTEICELLRSSGARDFGLSNEIEYFEQLSVISEITELVEREKKVDLLKWEWIENAVFFNYFSIERVFAFLLNLEMLERWISMDKEKGNLLFRNMIDALKNDVQIPAEFR
ncbi:DUF2764 family protein [uncultured Bacteroides sp.]|uniref:DUF2764 family protein n=1 Tax=uncultured Bacteroides sp. TaxID=162156 RepID=UPI002AAAC57B|nr:DUF2764 family protein [uncultured Bacteroides sp.]